ncbi:TraV family lipoprotein [Methylosarcina fibrata]|uniref:TraV family lipoprotein n=1 Tax=Methylosarcina fibrata TaxID=105972 RepID=UPI000362FF88|nr:TraV family lipoprotein [Methylosarcina fibrata]
MSLRVFIRLVLLGLTVFFSTGCATQYGCKGMPDDPQCLSTTEAYQVTDKALLEPPKPQTPKSEAVKAEAIAPSPRHARQPVPKIEDPTPIRTPAQVMRIWIAPWEDSDGDLMVSGYVYTELEPRRWMIGKSAPTVSPSLVPLQIDQRPPERPLDRDQAGSEIEGMPPGPSKAPNMP